MMRALIDLFVEPLRKRSAHFPAPGIRRRLCCDWGQGRRSFVLGAGVDLLTIKPMVRALSLCGIRCR